jgi:hypothetical protein
VQFRAFIREHVHTHGWTVRFSDISTSMSISVLWLISGLVETELLAIGA